jgi:hypothetical protein
MFPLFGAVCTTQSQPASLDLTYQTLHLLNMSSRALHSLGRREKGATLSPVYLISHKGAIIFCSLKVTFSEVIPYLIHC